MRATISQHNVQFIKSIFDAANKLRVELLIIIPEIYVPREYGLKYQNLMKKELDCEGVWWQGFEKNPTPAITFDLDSEIDVMLNKEWGYFVSIPAVLSGRMNSYFRTYEDKIGPACKSPWTSLCLLANGDATFCDDFPDYILGNITREPLTKIWNNRRAKRFRNLFLENGGLPICHRCCGLYRG